MSVTAVLKGAFRRAAKRVPVLDRALYQYRKFVYDRLSHKSKTDGRLIVFCTFLGKGYGDTPRALYERMLQDEAYRNYRFVWAFKEPEQYRYLAKNPRTSLVLYRSPEYYALLAQAKYWFHNYRVADHVWPRQDQIYVECWHGTPLKRLGFDLSHVGNARDNLKKVHQKYAMDARKMSYLISPSPFTTEVFTSAWNLKAFGREHVILEEGYPRNDLLLNYTEEYRKGVLKKLGLEDDGKKRVLYAPTWRDNQYQAGVGYTYELGVDFDRLRRELGEDTVILFRAHYLVANQFDFGKYEGFVCNVSSYPDIADLYIVSDLLVTDYSSVFFDYANLKRPIVFYMYDLERYKEDIRGFYFGLEELPGPIVQTEDGLIDAIREQAEHFVYDEKYERFHEKFNPKDDGRASERVLRAIVKD